MPDLLLWHVEERRAKASEVKGPRDRLSEQQRAWAAALSAGGLDVEVCLLCFHMTWSMGVFIWEILIDGHNWSPEHSREHIHESGFESKCCIKDRMYGLWASCYFVWLRSSLLTPYMAETC